MPPKPAAKLTKKQIAEQKLEAARLQKQKQEEEAAAEKIRLEEEQRLRQIDRQKRSEQERVRVVEQKQKYFPELESKQRNECAEYMQLLKQQRWEKFTTPYYKDYNVDGTNLSTFLKLFTNYEHTSPKLTLAECEECQKYISKLHEKLLEHRSDYNQLGEKECRTAIEVLHKEEVWKIEQIMIGFANGAEEMEQRNIEEAKRKNEQSSAQKAMKPIDSISEMSPNFKIGMYINTISTKNYNKFNPIGIKEFGFNSEVPPKWTNNTAVVKFEWMSFNPFGREATEEFRIVGGVFNLEFYDMFVGTKRTSNISIKKAYKGKQILQKLKLQPSAIKEPFRITYEIPKYVFMGAYTKGTIKMGQFDAQNNKWIVLGNDNITDYLEQEKRVICRISRPEPIALIENRCADYPYIAWELRTVEPGKVLLDIELARTLPATDDLAEQLM